MKIMDKLMEIGVMKYDPDQVDQIVQRESYNESTKTYSVEKELIFKDGTSAAAKYTFVNTSAYDFPHKSSMKQINSAIKDYYACQGF